jgi:aryl-alcohol dehydrogenase-like predicted oxidoreductase
MMPSDPPRVEGRHPAQLRDRKAAADRLCSCCGALDERPHTAMEYRTHEDFSISEIGIGCYALSGAYGPKSQDEIALVLDRAREQGVNFFDAAGSYGEAETILGRVMKPHRPYVCIATKIGLRSGAMPDLSAGHIRTSCEESLRRLGTDWIDLLQIHYDEPGRPIDEVIETLESLSREGKIRRYGIGHIPATRIEAYSREGRPFSALLELSAIARHAAREVLPVCRRSGIAGIAFSVTGRGLLSAVPPCAEDLVEGDIRQMDPLFRRERLASARRVAAKMGEIGAREGRTIVQVAIAWVLAQDGVVCALTGPSSIGHLDENLRASGWKIDPASARELEAFLAGEDAWVRAEQERSLARILDSPLPGDSRVAFVDLVYAIETAILLGRAAETELLPLFRELFGLRSMTDRGISARMESLRTRLRSRVAA